MYEYEMPMKVVVGSPALTKVISAWNRERKDSFVRGKPSAASALCVSPPLVRYPKQNLLVTGKEKTSISF